MLHRVFLQAAQRARVAASAAPLTSAPLRITAVRLVRPCSRVPTRWLHASSRRFNVAIAHPQAEQMQALRANVNRKRVAAWLLTTAGMVFIMVVLGGVTRLTRSGLSIVEWRPEGEKLPLNEEEWAVEFAKYRSTPEFQKVNRHMTLDEFKPIYWMEWAHRFWGRAIGIAFAGPLVYFAATRAFPAGVLPRVALLLGLGAAQGGVGWWMVKSGLEAKNFSEHDIPRVSPYRLATHLGFAFTLYSALLWSGLDLLRPCVDLTEQAIAAARRMRLPVWLATATIATTVASGAFVAGNDAGHAYNDWPLMAGRIIPEQFWEDTLGLRNLFENTATVQFDHRILAYASLFAVHGVYMSARKAGWSTLPTPLKRGVMALGGLVALQATLGISTLMLYVPPHLAATHQAGALALLTGALSLAHWVHRYSTAQPGSLPAFVAGAAKAAAPSLRQASMGAALAILAAGSMQRGAEGVDEE